MASAARDLLYRRPIIGCGPDDSLWQPAAKQPSWPQFYRLLLSEIAGPSLASMVERVSIDDSENGRPVAHVIFDLLQDQDRLRVIAIDEGGRRGVSLHRSGDGETWPQPLLISQEEAEQQTLVELYHQLNDSDLPLDFIDAALTASEIDLLWPRSQPFEFCDRGWETAATKGFALSEAEQLIDDYLAALPLDDHYQENQGKGQELMAELEQTARFNPLHKTALQTMMMDRFGQQVLASQETVLVRRWLED